MGFRIFWPPPRKAGRATQRFGSDVRGAAVESGETQE